MTTTNEAFEKWWNDDRGWDIAWGIPKPKDYAQAAWQAALESGSGEPVEGYPKEWIHATIHLNPETGEMHSDGDHKVRHWIAARLKHPATLSDIKAAAEKLGCVVVPMEVEQDAKRLQWLMDASGQFYEYGFSHQMIGRLREYIDRDMIAAAGEE